MNSMKSKSEYKREATGLQKLGEQLTDLSTNQLAELNLPDKLVTAILEYKKITTRGAKRRQAQYIGKLMRDIDPEPIKEFLAALEGNNARQKAELQLLEKWRTRLLSEDKTALTEYLHAYKNADAQTLRQLITTAKRLESPAKAKSAARALFRYLKETSEQMQQTPDDEITT